MSLSGRLEDMTLLEILQIIAFSKKTGTLRVNAPLTSGTVLFRDGMMHCAVSAGTAPLVRQLAGQPLDRTRTLLFQDQIKLALHEIVGAREGSFSFRNLRQAPEWWEEMDVSHFLATDGVDPQQMMLELARELDEARADSSSLLDPPGDFDFAVSFGRELSRELDAVSHESTRSLTSDSILSDNRVEVVLVDDEPQVLRALEKALRQAGCAVHIATGPDEARKHLEKQHPESSWFVITDVGMPSTEGDSFDGGFELVENLFAEENRVPVMLMAEALSPESRRRAMRLGIRKVAFKPTLTKPDADEYASDLQTFASVVVRELRSLVELDLGRTAKAPSSSIDQDVMFDFLKTMTDQLARPSGSTARNILRMAAKHAERALLFLVKGSRANGLAGIRIGQATKVVSDEIRTLSFELQEIRPFAEVVYSRTTVHLNHDTSPVDLFEQGKANDYVLLPVLHNHEVLAILFCDNVNTGGPLPNLTGLELFLVQAGMALENASLHRRLRSLATQFSIENQGPLTEELSRIVGGES